MRLRSVFSALVITIAAASFSQTTSNMLLVGDPAPKMTVSKWVKGTPVKNFEKGKLYVVEFWATWCGPCKESIPHLTELAKKYPDVSFTGVSVWESDQKEVAPFVKNMGDKMAYNVAMDQLPAGTTDGSLGAMAKTWMTAAGQNGIPAAFIIDRSGNIAWIGHPMALEEPLQKVIENTYGPNDYKAAKQQQELMLRMMQYDNRLRDAMNANDQTKMLSIMDEMMSDSNADVQAQGGMMKFSYLLSLKKFDDAYAVGQSLADKLFHDNSDQLNTLAWTIVDPKNGPDKKDLDLAMAAAQRSVDLNKNSANLDTLARVYFDKGDKAKALDLEKEALSLAPDEQKKDYEATIKEYGG